MKYARTYKAVMNRLKKKMNEGIYTRACSNKINSVKPALRAGLRPEDSFKKELCEMEYLQSGDATKMTFEQWRIKEIYRWGLSKKDFNWDVTYEIFLTKDYIEEREDKLTKEQKQELQNAIDDMNLYTEHRNGGK